MEVLTFLERVRGIHVPQVERRKTDGVNINGGDIRCCHLQGNAKASKFGTYNGIGMFAPWIV